MVEEEGAVEAKADGEDWGVPAGFRLRRVLVNERMVIAMPFGKGQGMGFGFRGSAPAWPYVGRGRGGLPRCWAFGSAAPYGSQYPAYEGQTQFSGGGTAFGQPSSPEQEIAFLKNQAAALRDQLNFIENRLKELGTRQPKGEG